MMDAACAAMADPGRRSRPRSQTATDQPEVWTGAMASPWRRASGPAEVP